MLLSARMLNAVTSVNDFEVVQAVQFTQGDTVDVYFQLVDVTKDRSAQGFSPTGRRYVPASGATLTAKLDNIDDLVSVSRAATQPYPTADPSIWRLSITATDKIIGTCALAITLTEAGVVTRGRLEAAALVAGQGTL